MKLSILINKANVLNKINANNPYNMFILIQDFSKDFDTNLIITKELIDNNLKSFENES